MASVAAPPTWVRFVRSVPQGLGAEYRVDRYRIESLRVLTGAPPAGLETGAELFRVETLLGPPPGTGELLGVTQHLGYQTAVERIELAPPPPPGGDAHVVVIPISKSRAWWDLAHDQRNAVFRDHAPRGHVHVGRLYVTRIHRKLYHSRYLPDASWDFITYFEFGAERAADFRALVSGLRDTAQNPEWSYVERESEIWMTRIG
ncbi:MAG TPA: chlorite dismutase family protein [Polyangiaceae bacterium]